MECKFCPKEECNVEERQLYKDIRVAIPYDIIGNGCLKCVEAYKYYIDKLLDERNESELSKSFTCETGLKWKQECNAVERTHHPNGSVTRKCITKHAEPVSVVMDRIATLKLTDKERELFSKLTIREQGETVLNPFSEVEVALCPEAVALYYMIKGAERFAWEGNEECCEIVQTGASIFIKNWPKEYMALLD